MYEVRTSVAGPVLDVVVDEGQLIAEDEPVAVIDTADGELAVVTDTPGVVREIEVVRGQHVSVGEVIARIDES